MCGVPVQIDVWILVSSTRELNAVPVYIAAWIQREDLSLFLDEDCLDLFLFLDWSAWICAVEFSLINFNATSVGK